MLKKILSAVGVLVLGFAVVVGLVYFELRSIVGIIRLEGKQRIPMYREAIQAKSHLDDIDSSVKSAFLQTRADDLAAARARTEDLLSRFDQSIKALGSETFAPLHSSILPAQSSGELGSNAGPTTVGQLVRALGTNNQVFREAATRSLQLAEQRFKTQGALMASREELDRAFRKTLEAQPLDAKGYATLARGVAALHYSSSMRDLNFAGRQKFREGLDAVRKVQTEALKPALDGLEGQFAKTFEIASASATSGADVEFFEAQVHTLAKQVGWLKAGAEREFDAGQVGLVATSEAVVRLSLIISGAVVVVGTGIAIWIARRTAKRICEVTRQVNNGTGQVSVAVSQLFDAASKLSDGASRQAASVEETSAAVTTIASLAKQNATAAQNAKELSSAAFQAAEVGAANVQQMEGAMKAIDSSSQDVGKILKTINEIAFQTNILALNAAVEAARAGEAGLGFAVVADEVRNLAQRCSMAAQETSEKIDKSSQSSRQGVEITQRVGQSLSEILGKVRSVDTIAADIARASTEQNQGIEQVRQGIHEIENVAQENAACSEETAASAGDLRQQARGLQLLLRSLEAYVGQGSSPAEEAPAHAAESRVGEAPSRVVPATSPSTPSMFQRRPAHSQPAATANDELPMPEIGQGGSGSFVDMDSPPSRGTTPRDRNPQGNPGVTDKSF